MLRSWQLILLAACMSLLTNCDDNTTFRSSVPAYPVRITIDTSVGPFVHFTPTAINSHLVVNQEGYFLNGKKIQPLNATDMYGYAGVVLYINAMSEYDAYDLCCPNCVYERQACTIEEPLAVCPHCGEKYDLGLGTGAPQTGIAKEHLRRLNVAITHYTDNAKRITITQRQ